MLVYKNFDTTVELVDFVNENRIRQECIESVTGTTLYYWNHEPLDLQTYGQAIAA